MTNTENDNMEKGAAKDPMLVMIEAQDQIIDGLGDTLLSHTQILKDMQDSMKYLKIEKPYLVEHNQEIERRPYNRFQNLLGQKFNAKGYESGDPYGSRRNFR